MRPLILGLPARPTTYTANHSCIAAIRRFASQDNLEGFDDLTSRNSRPNRNPTFNDNGRFNYDPNKRNFKSRNVPKDGSRERNSAPRARFSHAPRQKWMHVNPSSACIHVYKSPLLTVQYCSTVLLLRSQGIMLNPFHPLLRTALLRHQEQYETGYFFHLHTSSKIVTGKQASVRKHIRSKLRGAWERVLTNRGYDVKTGKFIKHLQTDWDRAKGHVQLPDLKGTVSINPNESCSNAPFLDIVDACEKGLDAVLRCKHRNYTLEEWMKPENLWRYYDWRRRDLLNKYVNFGVGLGINKNVSERFRQAFIDLRNGRTDIGLGGKVTEDGGYLLDIEGETRDIAPLRKDGKPVERIHSNRHNRHHLNGTHGMQFDPEPETETYDDKHDEDELESLFAGAVDDDGELRSSDLDWGFDGPDSQNGNSGDDASTAIGRTPREPIQKYTNGF